MLNQLIHYLADLGLEPFHQNTAEFFSDLLAVVSGLFLELLTQFIHNGLIVSDLVRSCL
jgi:hypothetical protein